MVVSVLIEELLQEEGQGETELSFYSLQERDGIIKKNTITWSTTNIETGRVFVSTYLA